MESQQSLAQVRGCRESGLLWTEKRQPACRDGVAGHDHARIPEDDRKNNDVANSIDSAALQNCGEPQLRAPICIPDGLAYSVPPFPSIDPGSVKSGPTCR